MTNRRTVRIFVAVLAVAAGLPSAAAALVVPVDCAAGRRIQNVLDRAPAGELVIEVRGMCEESLVIERSNVILRGADPATDGVRAPAGGAGNTVTVRDTHDVSFVRLTLTGGHHAGLSVRGASDTVWVRDCRIVANDEWGVSLDGGHVFFSDTTVSGNPSGGLFVVRGLVNCYRCGVTDNAGPGSRGVFVGIAALSMIDSTVSGSAFGMVLETYGSAEVDHSTVSGTRRALSSVNSAVSLYNGTLDGAFAVRGGQLSLVGMTQVAAPGGNTATNGAFVELRPTAVPTKLVGTTSFDGFSRGVATNAVFETLHCTTGADVTCDAATTAAAASCDRCRRP